MSKVTNTPIKCAKAAQRYRERLEHDAKTRYFEKLSIIGGEDPYELRTLSTSHVPPSCHTVYHPHFPSL